LSLMNVSVEEGKEHEAVFSSVLGWVGIFVFVNQKGVRWPSFQASIPTSGPKSSGLDLHCNTSK
jgi:hypothetical protein